MTAVARRYAKAIFSLAQEEKTQEKTGAEIETLAELGRAPELASTLGNPLLSADARKAVAETLALQLELAPTTANFVRLLADKNRLDLLPGIGDFYRRLLDQAMNRTRMTVTTASRLDADQGQTLVAAFEAITGKTVLAETETDAELLGGVLVEVEGKVYDGSVRMQLERLARKIAGSQAYQPRL